MQLKVPLPLPRVPTIRPDVPYRWRLLREHLPDEFRPLSVLKSRSMNYNDNGEPLSVYDQVALPPERFLPAVETSRPPFSVVLTVCESMIPAEGLVVRPSRSRHIATRAP